MSNGPVRYRVRARSPISIIILVATIVAAYLVPLDNWVQAALLGMAGGAIGGFASRGTVVRSFDPPDAPLATKRRLVALLAFVKLAAGFLIMGFSLALFSDEVARAFVVFGAYLAGTTAATPLSARDLGHGDG